MTEAAVHSKFLFWFLSSSVYIVLLARLHTYYYMYIFIVFLVVK